MFSTYLYHNFHNQILVVLKSKHGMNLLLFINTYMFKVLPKLSMSSFED